MKENKFIHQNKHKWLNFEQGLKNKSNDIEDWSRFFIQLSDDLSYARTHYPNRSVRVYLNSLMQLVFHQVIQTRRFRKKAIREFWSEEIPFVFYSIRKELRLAFIVFASAMALGAISSHFDMSFVRSIMGDAYVDMTIENIQKGDPMAVYKNHNSFLDFIYLTHHNLLVACITFVLGITAGLGTSVYLAYNGVLLGAFQYMCYKYGALKISLLTVWMHGSLEISAIVIAGAAGYTLAKGILFPGTFTRLQALRIHGVNAVTTMVGLIPLLIVAGFIEIFITRFTEWDEWLRAIFIISCFIFVFFYVIFFPRKKFKGVKRDALSSLGRPQAEQPFSIDLSEIKQNGRILEEVFSLFRINFTKIFRISALMAFLFAVAHMIFDTGLISGELSEEGFFLFISLFNPYDYGLIQCVFFAAGLSIFSLLPDSWVRLKYNKPVLNELLNLKFVGRFLVFFLGSMVIFYDSRFNVFLFLLVESFLLLAINVYSDEKEGVFMAANTAISIIFQSFLSYTGLVLVCILTGAISYLVVNSGIVQILLWFISWNLWEDAGTLTYISLLFAVFVNMLIVMCVFALMNISFKLYYYSASETRYAKTLKTRISAIP